VRGRLEREGAVIHVIAGYLHDMTALLHGLDVRSRDFH
jgi:error-prone DNA polymerase